MKSKFIFTAICFISMTLSINSCKNSFSNGNTINDPKTLLEKYLTSKTWQDRLLYISDSINVKPLMEKYYEKIGYNIAKFKDIKRIPNSLNTEKQDSTITMSVTLIGKNNFGAEVTDKFVYYMIKTANGLKIDWLSSTGYNPISLNVYQATKPTDVKIFRMNCTISDYYNEGYKESNDQYYSIECIPNDHENYSTINGYVLKNSVDGIKLFDILKDGKSHKVTIALKYDYKSGRDSGTAAIKKFITEGWFYDTNYKPISSEVLLDFLVNSTGTDLSEYQGHPDNAEGSQFTTSIKNYFEKDKFMIETKNMFQGNTAAEIKEYCTLTEESLEAYRITANSMLGPTDQTVQKILIKLPKVNQKVSWNYTDNRDGTIFYYTSEFTNVEYNGKPIKAIKLSAKNSAFKTITTHRYYLKGIGFYKECQEDEGGVISTTLKLV